MQKFILLGFLLFLNLAGSAQSYTLTVTVANQPDNPVILGRLRGAKFYPVDTIQGKQPQPYVFRFANNPVPCMYRLIFGQTLIAQVMHEPPQQLDFIFNKENVVLRTDFKAPEDSLKILQSAENKAWFAFKKKEHLLTREEEQLLPYLNTPSSDSSATQDKKDEYNRIQMERETFISQSAEKNKGLFASKLMKLYHEPISDAYLSQEERLNAYKKEYFNNLDFTDESLVNTTMYTDKVIHYIQAYGKYGLTRDQQENEFIKAVDVVMSHVNKDPVVYEQILDYIVTGFEKLNLQKALTHIADKYAGTTTCGTDEKTTLERQLEIQKMTPGTQVPDFTLDDINGDPVTLSEVLKPRTLVIFWASWCPHCQLMIPQLKSWYQTQDASKLEVVAVSIDTSKTAWQGKVKELGIESWYNLCGLDGWDGKVEENYNVYATPTMFLVDRNRKIIAKPLTVKELDEAMR